MSPSLLLGPFGPPATNKVMMLDNSAADIDPSKPGSWVEPGADAAHCAIETELVGRAIAGDGGAFSELVKPHLKMLFRIAVRACGGDQQLAEDAVQETLALVYQRLNKYTPGTSLKAFMGAIAARRAHTLIRAERRRRAREVSAAPPTAAATPEQFVAAEQARAALFTALERMPKKRREAVLLRLEGGLSYAEIADAMGSTEGSARVLVHLALKELKSVLASMVGS